MTTGNNKRGQDQACKARILSVTHFRLVGDRRKSRSGLK